MNISNWIGMEKSYRVSIAGDWRLRRLAVHRLCDLHLFPFSNVAGNMKMDLRHILVCPAIDQHMSVPQVLLNKNLLDTFEQG